MWFPAASLSSQLPALSAVVLLSVPLCGVFNGRVTCHPAPAPPQVYNLLCSDLDSAPWGLRGDGYSSGEGGWVP